MARPIVWLGLAGLAGFALLAASSGGSGVAEDDGLLGDGLGPLQRPRPPLPPSLRRSAAAVFVSLRGITLSIDFGPYLSLEGQLDRLPVPQIPAPAGQLVDQNPAFSVGSQARLDGLNATSTQVVDRVRAALRDLGWVVVSVGDPLGLRS